MAFTAFLQQAMLKHFLGTSAYTFPTGGVYVALFLVPPTTSPPTEISGNNYSRIAVSGWSTVLQSSTTIASNSSTVLFPTPSSGGWGTITAFGIYDSFTGGNLLFWGNLVQNTVAQDGSSVQFQTGSLQVNIT